MNQSYLKAFGLGIVAGMRSLIAPALLSHKLVRTYPTKQPSQPIHYLAMPSVSLGLKALAGGEIIGDKVPNVPDRTMPAAFAARVASGATCGGFLSQAEGAYIPAGVVAGGLGTVVGTVAFYHLRQWLDHELNLPDPVVALAEDALAISLGWAIVNSIEPVPQPA
ncbi:DUF4126 family protein [Spirosoma pulveris]